MEVSNLGQLVGCMTPKGPSLFLFFTVSNIWLFSLCLQNGCGLRLCMHIPDCEEGDRPAAKDICQLSLTLLSKTYPLDFLLLLIGQDCVACPPPTNPHQFKGATKITCF